MAMTTQDVRALILGTKLSEQPVSVASWPGTNLIIRELSAKDGGDLVASVSDASGKTDQTALLAMVVIDTLRNADDPDKALIFSPTDRDALMATGLGALVEVANASIKLSGLSQAAETDAKNA